MMKEYNKFPIDKYLDHLSSRVPAPGGGSAAALCAAMAAALLSMTLNFTIGKPKYAKNEKWLKSALKKSESLRFEFMRLVDLDAVAYASGNLRDSLNVPFMLSRLCLQGAELTMSLSRKCNPNLISDIGVAAVFFESAFFAASLNVKINLKLIKERAFLSPVLAELRKNGKRVKLLRSKTEDIVADIIGR